MNIGETVGRAPHYPIGGGTRRAVPQWKRESNSLGFGGFPAATATAPETTVPQDRGMRHSTMANRTSAKEQFVPAYRNVRPARDANDPAPPEGKRYIPPPRLPERPRPERVHTDKWNRRTVEEREFQLHMGNKIRVNMAVNDAGNITGQPGLSVGRRRAKEVDVAGLMQRKVRVHDTRSARNGIPAANPGDKLYSAVEYSDNFHQLGGLVPGANIATRGPKTGANVHMTMSRAYRTKMAADAARKTTSPTKSALTYEKMSFEAKRRMRDLRDEIDGVVGLTESGVRGKDEHRSWELRTGLSLTTKGKVWNLPEHNKLDTRLQVTRGQPAGEPAAAAADLVDGMDDA